MQLLKEVNRRLGITLVIITHQMSVIKEICSRVAVMQHGKIVEMGSVVDVFADPQAPITKDFIAAAGNLGSFYELLQTPNAVQGLDNDQAVWLLTFKGNVAGEPMMSELYRRFKVRANIIYGNIDYLGGTILGKLGIGVEGEQEAIARAKEFLIESNVKVEVLR
ncbi:MAG: NIL domain-containing protein [Candidatus Aphodousia sp.]|nr:NIL domain-containing protein [Candidatus Aphodousia sp.]